MKKLIYIDACVRGEQSRSRAIAKPIVEKLREKYEIEEIDLTRAELMPLDAEGYAAREAGNIPPVALKYAEKLATADRVLIAMPFWDMSFPSMFKVFCEHVTLKGITFTSDAEGRLHGKCAAEKIMLVTTRGADIEDFSVLDQASSYIKAIAHLWGMGELLVVSAIGTDACDDAIRAARLRAATEHGLALCEEF